MIENITGKELLQLLESPPTEIINPYPVQLEVIEFFQMLIDGDALVCNQHFGIFCKKRIGTS